MLKTLICINGRPEAIAEEVEEVDDFTSRFRIFPGEGYSATLDHVRGLYYVGIHVYKDCEAIHLQTDAEDYGTIFNQADEAIRNGTIRTRFPAL